MFGKNFWHVSIKTISMLSLNFLINEFLKQFSNDSCNCYDDDQHQSTSKGYLEPGVLSLFFLQLLADRFCFAIASGLSDFIHSHSSGAGYEELSEYERTSFLQKLVRQGIPSSVLDSSLSMVARTWIGGSNDQQLIHAALVATGFSLGSDVLEKGVLDTMCKKFSGH